jgi:hypothetical protein
MPIERQKAPGQIAKDAIGRLMALLRTCQPLELISRVATYTLSASPDAPEVESPDRNEAHLEYLISLATAIHEPVGSHVPSPDDIQETIDLLTTIHVAASAHHMLRDSDDRRDEPYDEIAGQLRANQLHVRGDAYWPHLRRTLLDLLGPHDSMLRDSLGFTSTDFFGLMERTERIVDDRFAEEMKRRVMPYRALMKPWASRLSSRDRLTPAEEAAFQHFLGANADAIAAAKSTFDSFGTPSLFVITAENVAEEAILAKLCCSLGDNHLFHGVKPEHAFWPLTESLTHHKPIIRHGGTHYVFLLPYILRGAYTLISELLREANPKYWKEIFLSARDSYLERETEKLLRTALPHATVLANVEYDVFEQQGRAEADIVVLCDDFLIIVECKAATFELASRRGAPRSVRADLGKTIVEAHNQAERLIRVLVARGELALRPGKRETTTVIRAADFRWVARVSVTLEFIGPAATSLWMLETGGMLENADKCWSVNINDLRAVVDILDSPSVFLHYLIRRMDLNALRSVHARDELDYLMHYVNHGLFFRDANKQKPNEEMILAGFTSSLDQYYRRVEGLSPYGKKPKVRVGRRAQRMLETLEQIRPPHYVSACLQLLEFDIPDREELLGKLPGHLKMLREKSAAFGFSLLANHEFKRGIALATTRAPESMRHIILGRAVKHCRDESLEELLVIVQGIPLGTRPLFILLAGPEEAVPDAAAGLLRQLRFETQQFRRRAP